MIYDSIHLSNAKSALKQTGPILGKSSPICVKCHQRKIPDGGKRYFDKTGRRRFVCKECADANAKAAAVTA